MAKVQAQVPGGNIVQKEASTVSELKEQMGLTNHQASVNGQPVEDNTLLRDFQFVTFAQKIKGAVIVRRNGVVVSRTVHA